MTASIIVGIFGSMALVAAPLGAARAAATAWVGDEHAAARLVTAVEATGSGRTVRQTLRALRSPGRPHTPFRTWPRKLRLSRSRAAADCDRAC